MAVFSSRCRQAFSEAALAGGDADFAEGRVAVYSCDEHVLTASVRDVGHRFTVMVTATEHEGAAALEVYCSCPQYRLGRFCRHLWAALRAADSQEEQPAPDAPGVTSEEPLLLRFDQDVIAGAEETPATEETPPESTSSLGATLAPFPPALRARLGSLFDALRPAREAKDGDRLAFVLDVDASRRRRQPCFFLALRREGPNETESLRVLAAFGPEHADRLSLEESALVHLLRVLAPARVSPGPLELPAALPEEAAPLFLERAAEMGRLYVQRAANEPALPATVQRFGSAQLGLGFRHKTGQLEAYGYLTLGDKEIPVSSLDLALPKGLFLANGTFGAVAQTDEGVWLHSLWREGSVIVADALADALITTLLARSLPFPFRFDNGLPWRVVEGKPQPLAVLEDVPGKSGKFSLRVLYQYGDSRVSERTQQRYFVHGEERAVLVRAVEEEKIRAVELERITTELAVEEAPGMQLPPGPVLLDRSRIPQLGERLAVSGWRLEWRGQKIRSHVAKRRFTVTAKQRWLELDGTWDIDGVSVPVPAILAALEDKSALVRLPDDSLLPLSDEERERWTALAALAKPVGKKLRIARHHALWLQAACEGETVDWDSTSTEWLQAYEELQTPAAEQAGEHFLGDLRPYQQVGLGWLRALDRSAQGGILADAMGLGKTVQCLAWLAERAKAFPEPSLIVVPKSLLPNWERETKRFAPSLRHAVYAGADRAETLEKALAQGTKLDLLFVTYQTLLRDAEKLSAMKYDCVILDEAQAIKNAASLTARVCRGIDARRRLAMTGTPVENGVGDLLSLLRFASPELLAPNFERVLREQGPKSLRMLGRAVRPFLLRRTKDSVLPDLPPKTEERVLVTLEDKEREEYDALVRYYRNSLATAWNDDGVRRNSAQILEALLRVRQLACHPGLLDANRRDESSAKLDALFTALEGPLAEGRKVLVFSQFREFLKIVARHFDRAGIGYTMLHGETKDRGAVVDQFQSDKSCSVLLATLKAGGLGLNLTAAEYVFLLDPWWNPAAESQAIDRAHRIGQKNPVFAYRLVAKETVEEKILALQEDKRAVARELVPEGMESFGGLTLAELRKLLE